MAIAITPFRGLCGFRPLPEIATALRSTPELASLLSVELTQAFLAVSEHADPKVRVELRQVFSAIMMAEDALFKHQLETLVERYEAGGATDGESRDVVDLVLDLYRQYPGDIGVFCAFLLNYIHLAPGEAIFLGAGEPHAYLSGGTSMIPSLLLITKMTNSSRMHRVHGKLG